MRALFITLLLVVGCNHDSPEDKQRFDFYLQQINQWGEQAKRGEKLPTGMAYLADNNCMQARRDKDKVKAARPVADACDVYLAAIKVAASK